MMMTAPVRSALALAVALAAGCAGSPPVPSGERRAVNDPGAIDVLVSAQEQDTHPSEYDIAKRQARERLFERRRFSRAPDPASLGELPGTGMVARTVSVPFGFNSARFMPTAEQALRIRELFAMAERIEVRGRTDGVGSRAVDEQIAYARAEAAKRYLIGRGVPGRIISVGYVAGGDYVADNAQRAGRRVNRRVDIEFMLLDEPPPDAEFGDGWVGIDS